MKILESYLELVEKESYLISAAWKGLQIFFYVVIAISGLSACISFSNFVNEFGGNCPLFSNIAFVRTSCENSTLPEIIDNKLEWSSPEVCYFSQYVPVCAAIFSSLWGVLFIMCGRGGKTTQGLSQPWRIVYPALIFNTIYFIVSCVSAARLDNGYAVFCNSFMTNMNETSCDDIVKYCLPRKAMDQVAVARASSWINMIAWMGSVIWLLLRCLFVVDFQVVKVTVEAPEPDKEENIAIAMPAKEEYDVDDVPVIHVLEDLSSVKGSKEPISHV